MENAGQQRSDDSRLGSYEIIRRLARGGMAELFLARTSGQGGFEKVVALKKILPKYADRQKYVSLFCDEARLAASLNHANIVQVYDIGLDGGNYFFAMEYLHGQDVRSILHRAWREGEKMPIRFAVQVATQVAAALHYAHNMKRPDGSLVDIVHRDVSPSNIIVTYDGAVKLLDFGVAKAATRTVKTRTGTLKGKISYMSPEQAKGAPVDRRSDIFSLGIVLWEMVTTSRLFRGENDLATLQLIINVPPKKPSEARPDCPPELERIVLKALSQDIANRYQTADQLVDDLDAFARSQDLGHSATALSVYVSELFSVEINSWNEAKAAGVPLGEHLTHIGDMTEPVMESEFIEAMDLPAMLAREEALAALDDSGDEHDVDDDDDDDELESTATATEQLDRFDTPPRKQPPTPAAPRTTTGSSTARGSTPVTGAPAARGSIPPARTSTAPPPLPPMIPRSMTPASGVRPEALPANQRFTPASASPVVGGPAMLGGAPSRMTPSTPVLAAKPDAMPTPLSIAEAPTQIGETLPDLGQPPPDVPSSNPWSVVKTPASGIRAWASGNFPALKIDPATATKWERRGLLVVAIIVALIIVIAIIKAIVG